MILLVLVLGGIVGLIAGAIALTRNMRELRPRWSSGSRGPIVIALVAGLVLAAASPFASYPFGYSVVHGIPFPAAGPGRPPEVGARLMWVVVLNAMFVFLLPQLALRLACKRGIATGRLERSRNPLDHVLLVATLIGLILYLPLVSVILTETRLYSQSVRDIRMDTMMAGPAVLVFLCVILAALWALRRGITNRGRLIWALMLTVGLFGWPVSCVSATIRGHKTPLIAH